MGFIRRTSLIFGAVALLVAALAFCPAADVGAVKNPTSVAEHPDDSEEEVDEAARLGAVAENCSNIKYALSQLQRSDSRTRIYLGTSYETISGRFIVPLNLRLERNNRPSEQLLSIQSEFMTSLADFRLAYTDYMRDLEALTLIDCSAQPADFYKRLETTRAKRAALQSVTQKLNTLAGEQYQAVVDLEKELK